MVRQRVRIRFRKQGDLRLIGHRDLARTLQRLFRRVRLNLAMSQGFHPKPRMSFPSALGLGIEGLDEVMELELAEPCTADDLLARLSEQAVPGLAFQTVDVLPPGEPKGRLASTTYCVELPEARRRPTADAVAGLLAASSRPVPRPRKGTTVDVRPAIRELRVSGGELWMRLGAGREATAGPRDVLAALGLGEVESEGGRIRRTRVELEA